MCVSLKGKARTHTDHFLASFNVFHVDSEKEFSLVSATSLFFSFHFRLSWRSWWPRWRCRFMSRTFPSSNICCWASNKVIWDELEWEVMKYFHHRRRNVPATRAGRARLRRTKTWMKDFCWCEELQLEALKVTVWPSGHHQRLSETALASSAKHARLLLGWGRSCRISVLQHATVRITRAFDRNVGTFC